MTMDATETGRHCMNVAAAAARIRLALAHKTTPPDLLDRFWSLQTSLLRLTESVKLEGRDAAQCRSVIRTVTPVLSAAQALNWCAIAAVAEACATINESSFGWSDLHGRPAARRSQSLLRSRARGQKMITIVHEDDLLAWYPVPATITNVSIRDFEVDDDLIPEGLCNFQARLINSGEGIRQLRFPRQELGDGLCVHT